MSHARLGLESGCAGRLNSSSLLAPSNKLVNRHLGETGLN